MKTHFTTLLGLLLLAGVYNAYAETFVQEYTYPVSEQDSRFYSRAAATNQVRSLLAQEVSAAVYGNLWSGWDKDQREKIAAITGDILEMQILEEDGNKWDGNSYHIKAQVTIDTEDVKERIAGVLQQQEEKAREEEEATRRALAAQKSFDEGFETREREYTYRATRSDNEMTAKINATELLRFEFLQEIGVYMQSKQTLTQSSNAADYQEKTEAIMAAIIQMVPIQQTWDKKTYYLKAQMTFNPEDVRQRVGTYLQNDVLTQELVESMQRVLVAQAERDSLNAKYERLENDYSLSKQEKERQIRQIQANYQNAVEQLYTEETFRQNCLTAEFKNKGFDSNSREARIYSSYNYAMGIDYYNLGRFEKALDYFRRDVDLHPTVHAYYAIGATYDQLNDRQQTINYYQKAAQLGYVKAQEWLKQKGEPW